MKILLTADGSHTLYNESLNETYHSTHGAIQESMHVFITMGFRHMLDIRAGKIIKIFEVGLGTGLNALLTAIESGKHGIPVDYVSIEPYPVPGAVIQDLNYLSILDDPSAEAYFDTIHAAKWGVSETLHTHFSFRKIQSGIQSLEGITEHFHLVYFDAFAPGKQPEMWHREVLATIYNLLGSKGVLVTYCAKGQVKRDLADVGFLVETLPGPPGKREMVRGTKSG